MADESPVLSGAEVEYSRDEIKKHNSSTSCWIIMDDDVFDLTKFLYEHPGGEEVLLDRAGGDGTDCFDNIGHSLEAKERRKLYKIGVLKHSERTPKTNKTEAVSNTDSTTSSTKKKSKDDSYLIPAVFVVIAFIVWFYVL